MSLLSNKYILILIWLALVYLLYNDINKRRKNSLIDNKGKTRFLVGVIAISPVIFLVANRGWFADTSLYIIGYRKMPTAFSELSAYYQSLQKDKGFYFVSSVIHVLFGDDFEPYLLIIAIFQGVSVSYFFRKYSPNYLFSIFLFVASTDYIAWMFNGIRQFMAVTIVLFATPFMLKETKHCIWGKYLPMFLIIALASWFHQSALLMIPISVMCQGKAWNKWTLLAIAGSVLVVAFTGQFTNIMNDLLKDTQYVNVVSDYTEWNDDGTNPLRVVVYCVPAILAVIGRKKIAAADNKLVNVCTNMSIFSAGLYIISMVTSGVFIGRLPIFCSLYSYILLPWEINVIFPSKTRKYVWICAIGFYLLFYYFQMHLQNGLF